MESRLVPFHNKMDAQLAPLAIIVLLAAKPQLIVPRELMAHQQVCQAASAVARARQGFTARLNRLWESRQVVVVPPDTTAMVEKERDMRMHAHLDTTAPFRAQVELRTCVLVALIARHSRVHQPHVLVGPMP